MYGNRAPEVIGVGRTKARKLASGLRPGGGGWRVGVNDAADPGEASVEGAVGWGVGGWPELASLDDAGLEVDHDDRVERRDRRTARRSA